jgi:hypothetical protein
MNIIMILFHGYMVLLQWLVLIFQQCYYKMLVKYEGEKKTTTNTV